MTGRKKQILLVDDEPDIARLVVFKLRKEGYDVILAVDGEEALKLVFEHHPDLVLLDLSLPGIDGYEVCRRIKADCRRSNIPIIFFTASGSDINAVAEMGKKLGAQDYVIKPFNSQDLLEKIKQHIGQ